MRKNNTMQNVKLDKEEKHLETLLEKGKLASASDLQQSKKMFMEAAKNYQELQTSKSITIRVNQEDLIRVKARAKRNNIPYQTLLNALIHKFAEGKAQVEL